MLSVTHLGHLYIQDTGSHHPPDRMLDVSQSCSRHDGLKKSSPILPSLINSNSAIITEQLNTSILFFLLVDLGGTEYLATVVSNGPMVYAFDKEKNM